MSTHPSATQDVEVQFKPDTGKAVIEGRTAVPFQSFVTLVLQRKVFALFKQWGRHSVIVDSELLTHLASAPQDSQENRGNLITVCLTVGLLAGFTLFAAAQALLLTVNVTLTITYLLLIAGSIVGAGIVAFALVKLQRRKKGEKLTEAMESLAAMLK